MGQAQRLTRGEASAREYWTDPPDASTISIDSIIEMLDSLRRVRLVPSEGEGGSISKG